MLGNNQNSFDLNFKNNNMLSKLIYINLAVFILVHLLILPFWLMNVSASADYFATQWFAVPSDLSRLLTRPWSIITYMFLHLDFWHILMNMIWLYFLGQLFVEFLGEKKLYTVYIAGGIAGALLYIIFYNVFPVFEIALPTSKALGASASVMAIVVAVATHVPNFSIRLMFIGSVKLKYIAIFFFVVDLLSMSNSNSGGHIAHIGGAALGFFFAKNWQKNIDITAWVDTATDFILAIFKPSKQKMKVRYSQGKQGRQTSNSNRKKDEQAKVDEILDKISRSGYDSLSKEEKDFLFKASNNQK